MKTLFVHVPMLEVKNGQLWSGPQNGACWAHSQPGLYCYVPFNFHTAYACSYLRLHGVDADFWDAWAHRVIDYSMVCNGIAVRSPDLLVLEMATPVVAQTLAIAEWAKREIGCKVMIVGQHMSAYIDEILKLPYIDAAAKNEFDIPCLKLANGSTQRKFEGEWEENVDTVNGQNWTPYIDDACFPNYLDPSMVHNHIQMQINDARSCPWRCTFCAFPTTNYAKFRQRSADMVLDEIAQVRKRHKLGSCFLDSETFTTGPKERLRDIALGLKATGLPWSMMTRSDAWKPEEFEFYMECGCVGARFGVESFHQHLLDRVEKHLDATRSWANMTWLAQNAKGFQMRLLTMIQMPGETPMEQQQDAAKYAQIQHIAHSNGNRCDIQTAVCTPLPGTKLWHQLQTAGEGDKMQDFSEFSALPDANSPLSKKLDTYKMTVKGK